MSKSLLIIGGTGFFGKSILDIFRRGLLKRYEIDNIIILARNTDDFLIKFPELLGPNVEFIKGDICNISSLPNADYIIHAAVSTNMNDYNGNLNVIAKDNIEKAVSNYCSIAPQCHARSKILYCSSGAVYGKQPLDLERISEEHPFKEDLSDLPKEKQSYCLGKRFAENEIINLGKSGLSVSIARCFAFSGKYLPKDQHYAYGNFIGQAERGETIVVKANGIIYRSYLEADDLVFSLLKCLLVASSNCPIYNVGSDVAITIDQLAKNISEKFSVQFRCPNLNKNLIIDRYVPNVDKLKKIFDSWDFKKQTL